MSSFIENFLTNINSTSRRRSKVTEMSKLCYTLFIHDEDDILNDLDLDDDLVEPTAFQIPVDMKWSDLQDLIVTEVKSPTKLNFTYRDDENDVIRIDSQEEYQTALDLCQRINRDLHIYTVKSNDHRKPGTNRRNNKREEDKRNQAQFTDIPGLERPDEDEVEILRPPSQEIETGEAGTAERIPSPKPARSLEPYAVADPLEELGAASAPIKKEEENFETPLTSVESNTESLESQETVPMEAGNSIMNVIRKEVREVMASELDDIWRFVNALKRDINNELDVIGEQLNARGRHQITQHDISGVPEIKEENTLEQSESNSKEEPVTEKKEDEGNKFAATFICESLLDGSIVHTCETYEKHWVFRNDGTEVWGENTKLHLLDETCDPPVATGNSLSEWGAKNKSVCVPALKHGESGVVCAEHFAPAHGCNYNSSWRLSHNNSPFGPRVWCSVRVSDDSGSPVDMRSFDPEKNLGSYEMVTGEQSSSKKSLEQTEVKSVEQFLVPPEKVEIEPQSPKHDEGLHNDNSIRSFNMDDISDGAKYIDTTGHESTSYNPAVTSVENKEEVCQHEKTENQEEEIQHESFKHEENEGASVDSEGSSSPVMVSPIPSPRKEAPIETEAPVAVEAPTSNNDVTNDDEEPRTLENEDSGAEEEDLYSSKLIPREDTQEENDENHVENFTEPPLRMHEDEESSLEEEQEIEEEQPVEPEPAEVKDHPHSNNSDSEDLHSVDFNLVDDNMTSYDVSDFVVVPLPDCFDVNRPLNVSEHEDGEKSEPTDEHDQPSVDSQKSEIRDEKIPEEENGEEAEVEENEPVMPPSDHEISDSEIESQPTSTTCVKEYKSEDSLPMAPKSSPSDQKISPQSPQPTPPQSARVNLAPTFRPPENNTQSDYEDSAAPDSLDNESLTERITKEFDAFLLNPDHPVEPQPKPKIPMNQIPTKTVPVAPTAPAPRPVPQSVLNQDLPYNFETQDTPTFPPFDQGWRRNPIPVPRSVTNNEPWVPNPLPVPSSVNDESPWPSTVSQLPKSEFTLNRNSNGIESTFPTQPFAVASPSTSLTSVNLPEEPPQQRVRAPSPQIELADDFYPPSLEAADFNINQMNGEMEIFRTPPPSPPPRRRSPGSSVELTPLDQLYEMGFHDLELNRDIFERCEHDLNRTVQALVLRQEADQDMAA